MKSLFKLWDDAMRDILVWKSNRPIRKRLKKLNRKMRRLEKECTDAAATVNALNRAMDKNVQRQEELQLKIEETEELLNG